MCRIARQKIAAARLRTRIQIICGDACRVGGHFDSRVRDGIEALQSSGLLNELFRNDNSQVVRYLKRLKRWFPGRRLFVVDYYGKLTRAPIVGRKYQHTLIHDLIQVLSAQGVPPADLREWIKIYENAGCVGGTSL